MALAVQVALSCVRLITENVCMMLLSRSLFVAVAGTVSWQPTLACESILTASIFTRVISPTVPALPPACEL